MRKLSKTKLEIMELFWTENRLSFSAVMDYFREEKGKNWKKQTLSTFLRELIRDGFLIRKYEGKRTYYHYIITKEQYEFGDIIELIAKKYHGQISGLIHDLILLYKIPDDEKQELIDIIQNS